MKLDFELGSAKDLLDKLVASIRSNRLWPLALVLLVAIVAVPIALSKSASGSPTTSGLSTPPPSSDSAVAALNVQSQPGRSRLSGHGRDPFPGGSGQSTTSSGGTSATGGSSSGTTAGGGSTVTGGGGGGGTVAAVGFVSPRSSPTAPPSITPSGSKPKAAPSGLAPNQSYSVSLAITNSSGGLNSVDALERLSPLPSAQQAQLVELGVLQGGGRVLFAVQPGTIVNGPGVCTPGPIDCEILSLAPGQTEGMSRQTASGVVQGPLFAVTGISATNQSSAQAAAAARREESAAGRSLIDKSPLTALSMFQYDPSLGAVVDLRNLAVGGS